MCKHIITDPSLGSLAYRLAGNNKADLLQELSLIVCEKDEKELQKIDSYFNFWCVRTMINMAGKRGSFTKLYSREQPNAEDINFEHEYDYTVDEQIERLHEVFDYIKKQSPNGWYKRDLFKLYVECGSLRKVEKEVGINYSSVYNTVKEVKEIIKDKL